MAYVQLKNQIMSKNTVELLGLHTNSGAFLNPYIKMIFDCFFLQISKLLKILSRNKVKANDKDIVLM